MENPNEMDELGGFPPIFGTIHMYSNNINRPNRRGHPKWWFSKGSVPKIPLIQV